jgi:hypothetical protein
MSVIGVTAFLLSGCSGGNKDANAGAKNDAQNDAKKTANTSTTVRGSNGKSTTTSKPGATNESGGSGPSATVLPASTPLVATWCRLRLGASMAEVTRAMGTPSGNDAASYKGVLPAGMKSLEWDAGKDVFVASFTSDRASILQVYDRKVGPVIGARDVPCTAYRRK